MNRYFIIDRINKEVIDTNNLTGDFDLYKEAITQIIDEIKHAGDIEDRKELVEELIEKLKETNDEIQTADDIIPLF